jgi:hypothetical protein
VRWVERKQAAWMDSPCGSGHSKTRLCVTVQACVPKGGGTWGHGTGDWRHGSHLTL